MSIFGRVRSHINDNRGKYGTAAGVAAATYGAKQIPENDLNQLGFNIAAKGHNFIQGAKEGLGMEADPTISQRSIDLTNKYYNSPVAELYSPSVQTTLNGANNMDAVRETIKDIKPAFRKGVDYTIGDLKNDTAIISDNIKNTYNSVIGENTINIKELIQEGYSVQNLATIILENRLINQNQNNGYFQNNANGFNTTVSTLGGMATFGAPVGAVTYAGRNQEAYKQGDTSGANGQIGPWDRSQVAKIQQLNNIDNVASANYESNKGQYFLNPMVTGPVRHGAIKMQRNFNNGLYNLLKNKNAPDVGNNVTVATDTRRGAFNAETDVLRNSANNYTDDIADIRRNNTGHYLLNPFVAGPTSELSGHLSGAINQGMRVATSPNSRSGDTLVHNIGRR